MKYQLIILLFAASMISCDSSTRQKQNSGINTNLALPSVNYSNATLKGKLYFFAPELDSSNYTATGACDCCSSNVLFLTDTSFVLIDYCEGNYTFCKGMYSLNKGTLHLIFDSLSVNKNYNWEKDTAIQSTKGYTYTIENIKPVKQTYRHKKYKNMEFFEGEGAYGAIDKERNFRNLLKSMKEEGILAKLQPK